MFWDSLMEFVRRAEKLFELFLEQIITNLKRRRSLVEKATLQAVANIVLRTAGSIRQTNGFFIR
jgi:hypothetical protein